MIGVCDMRRCAAHSNPQARMARSSSTRSGRSSRKRRRRVSIVAVTTRCPARPTRAETSRPRRRRRDEDQQPLRPGPIGSFVPSAPDRSCAPYRFATLRTARTSGRLRRPRPRVGAFRARNHKLLPLPFDSNQNVHIAFMQSTGPRTARSARGRFAGETYASKTIPFRQDPAPSSSRRPGLRADRTPTRRPPFRDTSSFSRRCSRTGEAASSLSQQLLPRPGRGEAVLAQQRPSRRFVSLTAGRFERARARPRPASPRTEARIESTAGQPRD